MSAVDTTEQAAVKAPEAGAERTRRDIFKYSEWVHVGPGAEQCALAVALRDDPAAGKTIDLPLCDDPDHFHAWVRLANPFQVRDITEKSQAARARMIRMLRDPESDAYIIMEQELDGLRDETYREILTGEILEKDFAEHYDEAITAVLSLEDPDFVPEDEDDEVPKVYANIEADQEEYQRQLVLPEDQRDETYGELEKTVANYSRAVDEELKRVTDPVRESLADRSMDELVEVARKDRIDLKANQAYLHTWNTWQFYVCTYKPRKRGVPNERYFSDIGRFKYETPADVIEKLKDTFTKLENAMSKGRTQGNS